ncbi:MAG: hypothetical protein KC910_14645 [Candidatus Eremiobacteraeota bacterium]|nr:hypothetical protein [Candidatus Eremiobacteraeota bacterium]
MEPTTDLAAYLDRLRQTGRRESEGHFTLDALKAGMKIRRFGLAAPYRCVLHVISAAVAGGASVIDFRREGRCLAIEFDGPPFTPEELASLWLPSRPPRFHELGLAVSGSQMLEPGRLVMCSRETGHLTMMEVTRDGPELSQHPLDWRGRQPNRFELHRGRKPFPAQLGANLRDMLLKYCRSCPQLSIDGQRLIRTWDYDPSPAEIRFSRPGVAEPNHPTGAWVSLQRPNQLASGKLWLESPTRLTLVLRGVSYESSLRLEALDGLRAVLASPDFQRDLAESGILQDAHFEAIMAMLEASLEGMLLELEYHSRGMLASMRKRAAVYLNSPFMSGLRQRRRSPTGSG